MKFAIGDWVRGKMENGASIHGYIESLDALNGIAKVQVVHSDNEEATGRTAVLPEGWVKPMAPISMEEAPQLLNLIDMALSTRDEAWFAELSGKLRLVQRNRELEEADSAPARNFKFRLGQRR